MHVTKIVVFAKEDVVSFEDTLAYHVGAAVGHIRAVMCAENERWGLAVLPAVPFHVLLLSLPILEQNPTLAPGPNFGVHLTLRHDIVCAADEVHGRCEYVERNADPQGHDVVLFSHEFGSTFDMTGTYLPAGEGSMRSTSCTVILISGPRLRRSMSVACSRNMACASVVETPGTTKRAVKLSRSS